MTDKELRRVETEAKKQGLELSDLFLLKEIDEIENQTESDEMIGLGLNIDLE